MTLIDILDRLDRTEETALTADGFDDCVIGLAYQFNQPLVVYSKQKIITQLRGRYGIFLLQHGRRIYGRIHTPVHGGS